MSRQPCFGIVGWKNSGKTSLVSGLVQEMSSRGLKISTIKHAHHTFDLDQPKTDSYAHRQAGANEVLLISAKRWAIQHELHTAPEPSFEEILSKLSPCDLVLVEGYKNEDIPKIEIIGPDSDKDHLWVSDKFIKAVACDSQVEGCTLTQFKRDQISEMADFIFKSIESA